jgi:vesicle coat complex subunit
LQVQKSGRGRKRFKALNQNFIWIIGNYCELIDNSVALISDFADNFKDEAKNVQLAILNAAVKLYLKLEGEAEDLIT